MIGSLINAAGILLGAGLALFFKKPLSPLHQMGLKIGLGAFTVFFGLRVTWTSLNGNMVQIAKQMAVVLLAMVFGKLLGKLLHLQKFSNSVGKYATRKMAGAALSNDKFNEGFLVCTALFCAAPLAMLASVHEGLSDFSPLFIVKALMDGAAAMAFTMMFGPGVLLSAIPVLAFQAALTRGAHWLGPALHNQPWPLADAVLATDGLLIFCVALIILQLKKIEIADYLPSLVLAPLLMRLFW